MQMITLPSPVVSSATSPSPYPQIPSTRHSNPGQELERTYTHPPTSELSEPTTPTRMWPLQLLDSLPERLSYTLRTAPLRLHCEFNAHRATSWSLRILSPSDAPAPISVASFD